MRGTRPVTTSANGGIVGHPRTVPFLPDISCAIDALQSPPCSCSWLLRALQPPHKQELAAPPVWLTARRFVPSIFPHLTPTAPAPGVPDRATGSSASIIGSQQRSIRRAT